ncbi:MAG TPA: hypothetical protein VNY05_46025 [Candidatus Acidoferrales bacterium]|jgi:predicted GH43/DUF377 family glycosyl hydrolase|nr:hypothetical protein [Candidatus Acidoferrales bacterium]
MRRGDLKRMPVAGGRWPVAGSLGVARPYQSRDLSLDRQGAVSRLCTLAAILLLSGCGRYADFTLPRAPGGDTSLTFTLEAQANPVIAPGDGWDSGDVLNPSVVRVPSGLINLYSGFDGHTWHTGLASSEDGRDWIRKGKVLSPDVRTWEASYIAGNGSAVAFEDRFWYWYVAGPKERPRLGLARSGLMQGSGWTNNSGDFQTWSKEPRPVLEPGPYQSWDEYGVADPYAIRIGNYFYMYFLGQDRARRQRLGVARSGDGVQWEKLRSNPILELGGDGAFDEAGLGEPAVWNSHGFYWMLYTGRDIHENRRMGLAQSTDGVRWTKLPAVFAGSQAWDAKVICDPTVLVEGGAIRVWFGGGDVASPDENLHGRIGYGVLRPVSLSSPRNATLAK